MARRRRIGKVYYSLRGVYFTSEKARADRQAQWHRARGDLARVVRTSSGYELWVHFGKR